MAVPVAELRHVSHHYGSVAALTDVSLSLDSGMVTALLGPNGAGKTTAVGLLTGLARPTSGQAHLFGGDPQSLAARRRIGVMLQVSKVPETLTVREHLTLFLELAAELKRRGSTARIVILTTFARPDTCGGRSTPAPAATC